MKLSKYLLTIVLLNAFSFAAYADNDDASENAKLALLISNESRLQDVRVSVNDPAILGEESIDGDESSTSIVKVALGKTVQTYLITRDGGGTIRSIVLSK